MLDVGRAGMNKFSIGKVLAGGFGIWFKNLLPFMLLTAVIYTPLVIWGVSIVQGKPEIAGWVKDLNSFTRYSAVLILLLNIFVAAAVTYGVVMELQGQRAGIGACIATGMSRFFPVLGVALMAALICLGGLVLLIVPGVIFFCMLYVATPVAVLEKPGVMASLKRSAELTKGHRADVFVIAFLLGLLNYGLTKLVEAVMLDPSTITADNIYGKVRLYMYVDLVRAIVLGSLSSVFAAVAYYFLRGEKEGTTASELAAVFE
jgi:uncharacterized membrane protein